MHTYPLWFMPGIQHHLLVVDENIESDLERIDKFAGRRRLAVDGLDGNLTKGLKPSIMTPGIQ